MVRVEKWMSLVALLSLWVACTPTSTKTLVQMPPTPVVSAVQFSGNTVSVTGSNFQYVKKVSIQDSSGAVVSDLSDFTFNETQIRGTISSTVRFAVGTVYNLIISDATASTTIPVSVDLSNISDGIGIGMQALNNLDITGVPSTTSYPDGDTILGLWGYYGNGSRTSSGSFPGSGLNPFADINFYNAVANTSDPTQPIASVQAARDASNYGSLVFFANSFSGSTLVPVATFVMTNSANYSNNPLGVGLTALSGANSPGAEFDVYVSPTPAPTIYAGRFTGGAAPSTVASNAVAIGGGNVSVGGSLLIGTISTLPTAILQVGGNLAASGSVGIGTVSAAPVNTLQVGGHIFLGTVSSSAADDNASYVISSNGQLSLQANVQGIDGQYSDLILEAGKSGAAGKIQLNTGGTSRITVASDGKVGIGTVAASYALDVNGSIRASSCLITGTSAEGIYTISTNAVATTAIGSCSSDARVKKEVKPYTLGLEKLLNVNPVTYKYNGLGEMPSDNSILIGVVAQDIEKTVPEVVGETEVKLHPEDKEKTKIKTVNYGHFTYMLINSVKELFKEFKGQNSEIAELKREIAALKKRIEILEKEKR